MPSNIIPLAVAKDKLREIDNILTAKYLLIGGIAVNHYIKTRNSHDIDLVCTQDQSYKVLRTFRLDEWNISDDNDDPTRPSYVASNKKDSRLVLKFGPKIVERGAYKYLDWDVLSEKSIPLTHQNVELQHIFVPNAAYLAYSKLVSFFLRTDKSKKGQDLVDFIDLSNSDVFSYTMFLSIVERLGASQLISAGYGEFLDAYKRTGMTTLLIKLGNMFPEVHSDESGKFHRGSSDFIARILDAALYFRDSSAFAIEEIRLAVENKRLLPLRLLYKTEEGVRSWLELCESPRYSFYLASFNNFDVAISRVVELIWNTSGRADFDLISLGVGDGKKERLLIEAFFAKLGAEADLYYYPIDVSLIMIERTVKQLSLSPGVRSAGSKLKIKPVIGDFFGVHSMDLIYSYRNSPNIFSVLGNTTGNGGEYELFDTLRNATLPGDFVLLEINTDQSGVNDATLITTFEHRKVDLAPLAAAGYSFSESDLHYNVVMGQNNVYSIVPETVSIVAECDVVMEDRGTTERTKVRTSVVHHYQLEHFATVAASRLAMSILHKSENKGVGLVLLHKPHQD